MQETKEYVLGFMLDHELKRVALIRKNPRREDQKWQTGLLNGIGGGVEPGEFSGNAMEREFYEETGSATLAHDWQYFCSMVGEKNGQWSVYVFTRRGDVDGLQSVTDEKVEVVNVSDISLTREDMIENVPWLIGMAIDKLRDGRPHYARVIYP